MRYAVVNSDPYSGRYNFGIWHPTEEIAIEEAQRLCRNEPRLEFIVLKEIGIARTSIPPVEFIIEKEM